MTTSAGTAALGAFSFVLHSHLPYARKAGRWPHGEEWIHEAASETYLPLIEALFSLPEPRHGPLLTLGITPVLAEQLADADVAANLADFMADKRERALADVQRFERLDEPARAAVARWYAGRYEQLLALFERLDRNIVAGFRKLQDAGRIEIASSAATHGYLPLMERDSTLYAQFAVGVQSYQRHFGRQPRTVWLPECAYRPAYQRTVAGHRYEKPGIEAFMAENGIGLFFVETTTIEGGAPVGKAAGDAVGPYGEIPRRYVTPVPDYQPPRERTTFQPYWVAAPEVAVFGRNAATGQQVWSADHGYPGDFVYREFHKKDDVSGLQYWRVTGAGVDLAGKQVWNPAAAFARTGVHADHFARLVEEQLRGYRERSGVPGAVVAAYDTELFGHWWFEGVEWLAGVIERLNGSPEVQLTAAGPYVAANPPEDVIALPESSWGQAGGHFTWLNADVEWMWPIIHAGERRMERLVEQYPTAGGRIAPLLAQTARELLLLESSDWPFLVTTGQASAYAAERFNGHVERFQRLAEICETGEPGDGDLTYAAELWERDKVFPEIDYRVFRRREPSRE